jgi:hypothetical protein
MERLEDTHIAAQVEELRDDNGAEITGSASDKYLHTFPLCGFLQVKGVASAGAEAFGGYCTKLNEKIKAKTSESL